jgi:2-polyprenyl-6-methoxyphenol hydroxylase-like FAD-dependent oxidoreductase
MRVAVAGGGVAGLTTAIALAARGHSVNLFERAASFSEIGAGIQLSPNAMAVLDRLGVTTDLQGRLFEPETLILKSTRSGRVVARFPLGKAARLRYGFPYCTLHRGDLQTALLSAARRRPSIVVHLNSEVHDVRHAENGVAFSAGGLGRRSDLLIGADGVHSRVRTSYFGHPGPKPYSRTAWRGTLPAADVAGLAPLDATVLWLGANAHVVHYPIRSGTVLNIVAITRGEGPAPPAEAFGRAARALIAAVSEWTPWPLLHVDEALPWSQDRVALVGDAAHAMSPSAAQGGAQAIEDAWVLTKSLADEADPVEALAAYERVRRPRVERVARAASRNLNTYELSGVPAIFRNLALKALPAKLFLPQLDWLFGWRPE